jgi:hypothetical protein
MKQLTSLVIVAGAVALAACASQAPAPAAATGATAAVTSTGTTANQASIPATAPATASATAQKDKFEVPSGYETVVVNGTKIYCHNVEPAGSRIEQRECLTQDQLEERQREAALYLENAQRAAGASGPTVGPGGAGR